MVDRWRRGSTWLAVLAAALLPGVAAAGTSTEALLYQAMPYQPSEVQVRALDALERQGDPAAIPALVELLRFSDDVPRGRLVRTLEALSGRRLGSDWGRWAEWQARQRQLVPAQGFRAWKGRLFGLIDPEFLEWFRPGVPARLNHEEIVWGGVVKDGIPALDRPRHIPASAADYLTDDELVFGVSINGDTRAYPHRIMDWHEMANDVVGGATVSLAY